MKQGPTERIPGDALSELSVGVVVPVFNEAETLGYYLSRLYKVTRARCPVVVVDGGSTDGSAACARHFFHAETTLRPNRGTQLNALADSEVVGGCFRLEFDVGHPLLKAYSWFSRFSGRFFHFGDQGFFIRREVFSRMGGFSPLPFLEDVDFLKEHRLGDGNHKNEGSSCGSDC